MCEQYVYYVSTNKIEWKQLSVYFVVILIISYINRFICIIFDTYTYVTNIFYVTIYPRAYVNSKYDFANNPYTTIDAERENFCYWKEVEGKNKESSKAHVLLQSVHIICHHRSTGCNILITPSHNTKTHVSSPPFLMLRSMLILLAQ